MSQLQCDVMGNRFLSNTKLSVTFCERGDILLFNGRNVFLHCDNLCGAQINILLPTRVRGAVLFPSELAQITERSQL